MLGYLKRLGSAGHKENSGGCSTPITEHFSALFDDLRSWRRVSDHKVPFNRPYMTGRELAYIAEAHSCGHLAAMVPYPA